MPRQLLISGSLQRRIGSKQKAVIEVTGVATAAVYSAVSVTDGITEHAGTFGQITASAHRATLYPVALRFAVSPLIYVVDRSAVLGVVFALKPPLPPSPPPPPPLSPPPPRFMTPATSQSPPRPLPLATAGRSGRRSGEPRTGFDLGNALVTSAVGMADGYRDRTAISQGLARVRRLHRVLDQSASSSSRVYSLPAPFSAILCQETGITVDCPSCRAPTTFAEADRQSL